MTCHLLVVSVITPTVVFRSPGDILPSNNDTFNVNTNFSSPSTISSLISDTLTLLIVIPTSNLTVTLVVLKSTLPVGQTLLLTICIDITILPSAETGDCSDGAIVTSNGILTDPPISSNDNIMFRSVSEPKYLSCVNLK